MSAVHIALGLDQANQEELEKSVILPDHVLFLLKHKLAMKVADLASLGIEATADEQIFIRGEISSLSLIINESIAAKEALEAAAEEN